LITHNRPGHLQEIHKSSRCQWQTSVQKYTRCLRLAVPRPPSHLLSHSHVSLPYRLGAPLTRAIIAAFLSTAHCLVQLSSYPDPARTISRSPLAHLTPAPAPAPAPPAAHETRSQTCRSRGKVTAHTQQLANAREVAERGPTLLPSLPSCPDTSWPSCEIIFFPWL
jgi:hypothetical protein